VHLPRESHRDLGGIGVRHPDEQHQPDADFGDDVALDAYSCLDDPLH
jgi:hypothetical protein